MLFSSRAGIFGSEVWEGSSCKCIVHLSNDNSCQVGDAKQEDFKQLKSACLDYI